MAEVDEDARLFHKNGQTVAGYNVQTAVDDKHKLLAVCEVTQDGNDENQLKPMSIAAKTVLEVDTLSVVADAGYFTAPGIRDCQDAQIIAYIPEPDYTRQVRMQLIEAKKGYVLDTSDTGVIVTQGPAANRIELKVYGKDAHAGVAPEEGINAIAIASLAVAGLTLGRIDHETTCNIGVINGGVAVNIVPKMVSIQGEVRSHDDHKLEQVTENIIDAFRYAVDNWPQNEGPAGLPRIEYKIEKDFPITRIPPDHPVISIAQKAASNLGRSMRTKSTGGGADANIFFEQGITAGVIGTGMKDMHSVRESIRLNDMVRTAELLIEIIRLHSI